MRRALSNPVSLAAIVEQFGGELQGDAQTPVARLASLRSADGQSLSFLARTQQKASAAQSRAGAFVVSKALSDALPPGVPRILADDPYHYVARLSLWFGEKISMRPAAGVHPSAQVDASAELHPSAVVEAGVVIGAQARIGARAWIGANSVVGPGAAVGEDTRLHPRVSLLDDCVLGARCILHSGVVIGADGFGFAPHQRRWQKIAQLGTVVIGNDVEIGANTCIDRGALDDTVIEDGVKLDNLIQIAHNVHIGEHTAIAACAGVAGSAVIGKRCQIGGASGIAGFISICDDAAVSTMTLISRSITRPGFYSGIYPSMENAQWERSAAVVRHLPELRRRVIALEKAQNAAAGSPDAPDKT